MTFTNHTDDEQAALWNGSAGHAWVEAQEFLDRLFQPFEDLLVESASAESGTQVLDVGCGMGATTLAVARRLGETGRAVGIDISDPLIAGARARAQRENSTASFIRANAETYNFEPRTFDMIISRFGVMFFDDSVKAFANLRRAATEDAKLRFLAWRSAADNPFMTTAERAAAPLLPNLPPRRPDAPGQFAFGEPTRVHTILEESGWAAIDIQPIDVACTLPEAMLVPYLTRLGPVGRMLEGVDDGTREQVVETARRAFDPYVYGSQVRFTAACWSVGARTAAAGL